jgi:polysaccharide biosynthesis protein PslH
MAKIGVITSRFPFPLDKGDKLRIFNQVKSLSKNHQIKLVCITDEYPDDNALQAVKSVCHELLVIRLGLIARFFNLIHAYVSGLPLQVGLFFSKRKVKQIHHFFSDCEAIYAHLIRVTEYVKDLPQAKTLDYMDAFSKGVERWHQSANVFLKPILKLEHKRLVKYEASMFSAFDHKVIITDQDKYLIPHKDHNAIQVIPNGVDFEQYKPVPIGKKYDILFSGNMGYVPNIDAAYFAATKIMPQVWNKNKDVSFLIAGIGAPEKIKRLASPQISVIENYEDINLAYSESKINIAPMFLSIGLQNKILQGMANRIPNISTTLANNAVNAIHHKEIIEANDEHEFADEILRLLADERYYETIANNGYTFVRENYSWDKHNQQLENIILSRIK